MTERARAGYGHEQLRAGHHDQDGQRPPVVWSNPHYKAHNVYIFMGHHAGLFDGAEFVQTEMRSSGGGSVRKYLRNAGLLACLCLVATVSIALRLRRPPLTRQPPKVCSSSPSTSGGSRAFRDGRRNSSPKKRTNTAFAWATSNWADMNGKNLARYKLVVWLNGTPRRAAAASAIHGERRRMARLPCRGL